MAQEEANLKTAAVPDGNVTFSDLSQEVRECIELLRGVSIIPEARKESGISILTDLDALVEKKSIDPEEGLGLLRRVMIAMLKDANATVSEQKMVAA